MFQSKLGFLSQYGITFGGMFENIQASREIIVWLFFAFILVLFFKNSMEKRDSFKPNYLSLISFIIIFIYGVISMSKESEFLYFNF
jgi:alginate O-acetyltransferase complex protein AlgI